MYQWKYRFWILTYKSGLSIFLLIFYIHQLIMWHVGSPLYISYYVWWWLCIVALCSMSVKFMRQPLHPRPLPSKSAQTCTLRLSYSCQSGTRNTLCFFRDRLCGFFFDGRLSELGDTPCSESARSGDSFQRRTAVRRRKTPNLHCSPALQNAKVSWNE